MVAARSAMLSTGDEFSGNASAGSMADWSSRRNTVPGIYGIIAPPSRILQKALQSTGEGREVGREERGQQLEKSCPQRGGVCRKGLARREGRAHAVGHDAARALGAEGEAAGRHAERANAVN